MSRIAQISDRKAGTTDVVVIGAGHSGLAVSYLLKQRGVDHVVLERGDVGNAWRERSWASLRLLTPNRRTVLPGFAYAGSDPDGFMSVADLVGFLEAYAEHAGAPVRSRTAVHGIQRIDGNYRVETNGGEWTARAVVLATGTCNTPSLPAIAGEVPAHVRQLTAHDYRSPEQLAAGGVLVVGASATGLQFADELVDAGREVLIAAGEHVRLPRHYRGRDIFDWMESCGILDEGHDDIDDLSRGRALPSPQLVGSNARPMLDLNCLTDRGARVTGRLMAVNNGIAQFSGSLRNVCALADLKMRRLLDRIDALAAGDSSVPAPERFDDTRVDAAPLLTLDLRADTVKTIIWATGFRANYDWLRLPVLDRKGRLRHDGGILDLPGLYAMGLPLMRRRKSTYIFGAEDDARDITNHLVTYLDNNQGENLDGIYQDDTERNCLRRSA